MQRINQLQAAITGDGHGKLEDLSPPLLGQCLKMKTHFPHIYACIYIYILLFAQDSASMPIRLEMVKLCAMHLEMCRWGG